MSERETPREIKPHLKTIEVPEGIRALAGWLIWRYEAHEGEKKPRKVPYWTSGGRRHGVHGRPEDRASLTTFDAAKAAAARRGFDGVGFAMLPEWGLAALDFDGCVGPEGLSPVVEALVGHTYAEYSPSGRGVRAIVKGNLGNHRSPTTDAEFGFETYSTKGFVTFTGNRLDITELLGNDNRIGEVTPALTQICQRRFSSDDPRGTSEDADVAPLGLTLTQADGALDVLDPDMPREPWRNHGMALHHEFGGSDEAFELWDTWSQKSAKYPGRNGLLAQWESFGRRDGRPVTARSLIKAANAAGAHINLSMASPSDFEVLGTTKETSHATVSQTSQEPPAGKKTAEVPPRFPVIPAGEFSRRPSPEYIVESIVPRAALMVVFGESGSGKTFAVLDIVMCIARAVPWRAFEAQLGKVVYLVAEGQGGFRNRLVAYAQENKLDLDTLPFGVIETVPNLLQKEDALDVAKSVLGAMGKVDVIVIDTFAQTTAGGNENSGEDVGKAIAHCRGIHKATGALVILVHHSGKDSTKGARGWSGLRAAVDAEIEVVRLPTGRKMRLSKQKDGEDGLEFGFELLSVPIGTNRRGAPITSCVVREAALPAAGSGLDFKPGPVEQLVIDVMTERSKGQLAGIEVEFVVSEAAARLPAPTEGKRDTRAQRCRRALLKLCEIESYPYFLEDGCISIL